MTSEHVNEIGAGSAHAFFFYSSCLTATGHKASFNQRSRWSLDSRSIPQLAGRPNRLDVRREEGPFGRLSSFGFFGGDGLGSDRPTARKTGSEQPSWEQFRSRQEACRAPRRTRADEDAFTYPRRARSTGRSSASVKFWATRGFFERSQGTTWI